MDLFEHYGSVNYDSSEDILEVSVENLEKEANV